MAYESWLSPTFDLFKDDEDEVEDEEGGLSTSGKELKKLLGKAAGLDESDVEEEDEDDDVSLSYIYTHVHIYACICTDTCKLFLKLPHPSQPLHREEPCALDSMTYTSYGDTHKHI